MRAPLPENSAEGAGGCADRRWLRLASHARASAHFPDRRGFRGAARRYELVLAAQAAASAGPGADSSLSRRRTRVLVQGLIDSALQGSRQGARGRLPSPVLHAPHRPLSGLDVHDADSMQKARAQLAGMCHDELGCYIRPAKGTEGVLEHRRAHEDDVLVTARGRGSYPPRAPDGMRSGNPSRPLIPDPGVTRARSTVVIRRSHCRRWSGRRDRGDIAAGNGRGSPSWRGRRPAMMGARSRYAREPRAPRGSGARRVRHADRHPHPQRGGRGALAAGCRAGSARAGLRSRFAPPPRSIAARGEGREVRWNHACGGIDLTGEATLRPAGGKASARLLVLDGGANAGRSGHRLHREGLRPVRVVAPGPDRELYRAYKRFTPYRPGRVASVGDAFALI